MTRVGAIDCGTNSLRLLIADVDTGVSDLVRRMEIVRLGAGVDRTGRLAPDALARTFSVLESFAATLRELRVTRIRMVATSATRDAANRDEFIDGVRRILGVEPDVVTGADEAELSFAGALRGLGPSAGPQPYLVVDIGGGSTEFILGSAVLHAACSVDVGCVRLTERHLLDDPPTEQQIAAARVDVEQALTVVREQVPVADARTLVGLAGSVTSVAALALDLAEYDPARIHHARIPASSVHAVAARLLSSTRGQRAAMTVLHAGRVDVIGAGALILDTMLDRFGFGAVLASEHDILDGIALSLR